MSSSRIDLQRILFQGRVVRMEAAQVHLPGGNIAEYEIIRHPGSAAVVAIDEHDRVCLLRQFRPAAGGWVWEIPAGRREHDETAEQTARRELAEEAGCVAVSWRGIGAILSSPGVFSEEVHLFLAARLAPHPVDHKTFEAIEIHWVNFEEAVRRALAGELRDAKSIVGLLRARDSRRSAIPS